MTTLAEWAAALTARHHAQVLKSKSRPWTPSFTPATDLGYRCERRIQYHRVLPDAARPLSEELACIFAEGDLHERDVRRHLDELGAELVENQRTFRDERLEITGTIDGKLVVELDGKRCKVPTDIKSTSGTPPTTEEELRSSDSSLYRRYHAQMSIYMLLTNEPEGLLLFKEKTTGTWTPVALKLDFEYTETLLQKAERVRDAVRAYRAAASDEEREAAMLPRETTRADCKSCPWFDVCKPGDAAIDPLLMAKDEDLVRDLEAREATSDAARAFDKIDKRVKDRLKLTAGDRFIAGHGESAFIMTKKTSSNGAVRISIERLNGQTEKK